MIYFIDTDIFKIELNLGKIRQIQIHQNCLIVMENFILQKLQRKPAGQTHTLTYKNS